MGLLLVLISAIRGIENSHTELVNFLDILLEVNFIKDGEVNK
jgi:hypothetical protein